MGSELSSARESRSLGGILEFCGYLRCVCTEGLSDFLSSSSLPLLSAACPRNAWQYFTGPLNTSETAGRGFPGSVETWVLPAS